MSDRPHPSHEPPTAETDRPDGRDLTPLAGIIGWVRSRLARTPTADEIAAVDELIPEGPEFWTYVGRFSALIVLSASIAAFGLLSDSAAVVIGAMLVAPLMTPITAASAATVTARNPKLWRALAVVAWGMVLAVTVGWLTSLVAGGAVVDVRALPGEVRARTFPTLLDLGVAISAGAAAGYILPRRSTAGALPGVGIAVALVPPLATVGITAELGLSSEARNAFLLFLTNLAAIVFAAGIALLLAGFRPSQFTGRRALRTRILLTVLSVVVVAIPLTIHSTEILEDQRLKSAVTRAIETWDRDVRIVDLVADASDDGADVEVLVVGRGDPQPPWRLAEEIRARFGRGVDLRLLYQRDELYSVSSR